MNYKKLFFISVSLLAFFFLVAVLSLGIKQWNTYQHDKNRVESAAQFKGLSEEEKSILFGSIGEGTSEEDLDNYFNLIYSVAIRSDTLTVDKCKLYPPVLSVNAGDIITIINDGNVVVILNISATKYVIGANSELKLQIPNNFDQRALGFSCTRGDGLFEPSQGLIVLPRDSFSGTVTI
jgi:hypothetical protein